MKTKLNTISNLSKGLLALTLVASFTGNAQEKESNFTFGANADGYYRFDASRLNGQEKTRFTEAHNSFELGMASFEMQHKTKKTTLFVDLGAGKRADQFSSNSQGQSDVLIKQAYFAVEVADGLTITGGSWKKHIGYEQINAVDNGNYSMSYAFSNGSFFNTGLKLDYKLDKLNFMVGISNPTDLKSTVGTGTTQKNVIAQLGYTGNQTKILAGLQTRGNEAFPKNVSQNDLIVEHKFNDKLTGVLNATNTFVEYEIAKSWFSVAAYLKYKATEKLAINYRGEYFDSSQNIPMIYQYADYKGSEIISNTISVNYKIGDLTIIPELRVNYANEKIYSINSELSNIGASLLVGTTYKF